MKEFLFAFNLFLFIRVSQDIDEAAKIAKILLLLENGKGNELSGRSLNDIKFQKDVYYSSDSEVDDIKNRSRGVEDIAHNEVSNLDKKKVIKKRNKIGK